MNYDPPKGFRDFTPEITILRKEIFDKIEKIFQRFGYDSIITPIVEYWDILKGKYGEEAESKLIWRFKLPFSEKEYALRYDHTVPLARFYSRFRPPLPFKRYVIDRVYRYDEPQKGRYREFWQADFDIIGSKNPEADAEVLNLINFTFKEFGFKNYKILLNNRRFLYFLFEKDLGLNSEVIKKVYIIIDKLDKIGIDNVEKELINFGLNENIVEKIIYYISLEGEELLDYLYKYKELEEDLNNFNEILDLLEDKNKIKITLSLVRGLDYYTGTIFEVIIDNPKIGSLAGGGRYDNLIKLFTGTEVPAVGGSIGVERLIDSGIELGIFKLNRKSLVDIGVVYVGNTFKKAWEISNKLRDLGFNVYIDLMRRDFNKQVNYLVNKGVRYLVIVGEKDLLHKKVTIQDRLTKEKYLLDLDNLEEINKIIKK